jgi:ABC-type branched-subunit amino acid transport system substrate-binding protein
MKKLAQGIVLLLWSLSMAERATATEVVFGQIASTGSLSARGLATNLNFGYQIYFDKLNSDGGVNGNSIKLVLKDDGLKADAMVQLTKEFLADPSVIGLVGYLNTPGLAEIAKQKLLVDGGMALVSPMQGDKRLVSSPNFFPFRSGYLDEVSALVKEAKQTQKQRFFIIYQSTTLGPGNAAWAEEEAKRLGLPLAGKASFEPSADKLPAAVRGIVEQVVNSKADAVLLISAGAPAFLLTAALRDAAADSHIIYAMSVTQMADLPPSIPVEKARGVILAQSVPYPFAGVLPIVREYQRVMKERAPGRAFDYLSLEGYIGAKIVHEALKRAGKKPTRQSFLAAIKALGTLDLGGVTVSYSEKARLGWEGVDLTIISRNGSLQR